MTKRKQFFLNGLLLTTVGLSMKTASLLFSAYIAGQVGAEAVGLYTLVMAVYAFALTFATSGISLTVTRLVASNCDSNPKKIDRIIKSAVEYSLFFGIISTALMFLLSGFLGNKFLGDTRATASLQILSLSLIPVALSATLQGYFVAVRRVSLNAITQVLGQTARVILTVLFLMNYRDLGVEYSVLALSASSTLTEIICFIIIFIEFKVDRKKTKSKNKTKEITVKTRHAPTLTIQNQHLNTRSAKKRYSATPTTDNQRTDTPTTENQTAENPHPNKPTTEIHEVTSMALPLAFSAYIRSALLSVEHSLIPKLLIRRGTDKKNALSSYGFLHGMALPMILYPMSVLTSFSGLLVPEFSETQGKGDKNRMSRITSEALNTTLLYATVTAVFLYLFSEELGYTVYSSYTAGFYISVLSPVIPIMYLDHVTDSILKGIGEHVFSMWVNIADSLISVILVWLLIPIFGIGGYATVIIIMELFNYTLSKYRLKKRIHFKINYKKYFFIPLFSAIISSKLTKTLIAINGSTTTPIILTLKVIFAVCLFILFQIILDFLTTKLKRAKSLVKTTKINFEKDTL